MTKFSFISFPSSSGSAEAGIPLAVVTRGDRGRPWNSKNAAQSGDLLLLLLLLRRRFCIRPVTPFSLETTRFFGGEDYVHSQMPAAVQRFDTGRGGTWSYC